jgi:hypothetical protein
MQITRYGTMVMQITRYNENFTDHIIASSTLMLDHSTAQAYGT